VHLLRAAVPVARYDLVVQEDEIALVRRVLERVSEVLREGIRRCDGPTQNGRLSRLRGGWRQRGCGGEADEIEPGERFEESWDARSREDGGERGFERWEVVRGEGEAEFLL
jgi:hypothetical protein